MKDVRIAIYTCLTGGYDGLLQPKVIDPNFDYICFSNDIDEQTIGVWQIRHIPSINLDNVRLSRYSKIKPHMALEDYEYSLYMDANLQITGNELYDAIKDHINRDTLIAQLPHLSPKCDCIYDEIPFAIMCGKAKFKEAYRQFKHLQTEGFPEHFGLFENNVIFRKHNTEQVRKISEGWWQEYCEYTKRDQFSLMYVYWKNDFMPCYIFDEQTDARNIKCISYLEHPKTTKALGFRGYIERQMNKVRIKLFMHKSW